MMRYYKFFRETHKWSGIVLAIVFLNVAVSGLLLLEKKNFSWIQPETIPGTQGSVELFITNQRLFESVLSRGHEDFRTVEDVDRIDFRPDKRVFKVRSKKNFSEIQVDAVTGEVLSIAKRNSDLIETLHDGSFFGGATHALIMPVTALAIVYLTFTGLYLWLAVTVKRFKIAR